MRFPFLLISFVFCFFSLFYRYIYGSRNFLIYTREEKKKMEKNEKIFQQNKYNKLAQRNNNETAIYPIFYFLSAVFLLPLSPFRQTHLVNRFYPQCVTFNGIEVKKKK